MKGKDLCKNQVARQGISFQVVSPRDYDECQTHRAKLCADILKRFFGKDIHVVDAGCGTKLLKRHFKNYTGVDLVYGDDIEKGIPSGDVVVFMNVLEHVVDLQRVLDNVHADYVYISVPQEHHRMSSPDHVRHLTLFDIKELMPEWTLMGKWFWVLKPRFWRLRYLLPIVSVFAEDEISLWQTSEN